MERVYLEAGEANKYFKNVVETLNISRMHLAELLRIDIRTLNDWKNGKYGIPVETTNWINGESGVKLPVTAKIIDSRLIKSVSGRKGAVVRNKLYGSPGTFEGRRKGGFNSLQTHRKLNTGFKLRKIFIKPAQSVKLAEMFGILIGDGGLSRDQVKITLSSRESAYTQYAIRLAQVIFGYSVSVSHFHTSTNDVYVSSRSAVEFLNDVGLPVGNKVKQNHRIPDWIKRNPDFLRSCLKGVFDTDGSIFLDKHVNGKKRYASICLAYTTYSAPLLSDIENGLRSMGFSPVLSTKNRVMIRKSHEIARFFDIICPANAKHIERFSKFKEECRELATGRSRKALS